RIIMTHGLWRPSIQRAIYMVRDGRDALVSFYHYSTTRRGKEMTFDEFLRRYERGAYGYSWHRHLESWLNEAKVNLGKRLVIVRFEDLNSDPERGLQSVCQFLGLATDASILKIAVKAASVENMKRIEALDCQYLDGNASFYRGGRTGQWMEWFDDKTCREFERLAGPAMKLAGYD
ncbi:MAG: sulfotransferase domain-containing protein, partial [Nitrososphaera sp.]|nr:sulfotransferase domain-containing protein [Nitrososphaera sp.]